jgi:hypothetical protein
MFLKENDMEAGNMKKKSDCPNFLGLPTNPDVCAKWIRPSIGARAITNAVDAPGRSRE